MNKAKQLRVDLDPIVSVRRLCQLTRYKPAELQTILDTLLESYKPFDIEKGLRSDGTMKLRHIDNPTGSLKKVQSVIQTKVLYPRLLLLPEYMYGGMPGRSIKDNAFPHQNKDVVVGLDIENCYPNISNEAVFNALRQRLGFSTTVSSKITRLTTLNGGLPQGAPTSPFLCNLVLASLAEEIDDLAKPLGVDFTIYVDDITLSGPYKETTGLIKPIIRLVTKHKLRISPSKTSIMDSSTIQAVTGIKVNDHTRPTRERIEATRKLIIRNSKKGYMITKHELNAMWGLIQFIKSIDEKDGLILEKLAKQLCSDISGLTGMKPNDIRHPCSDPFRKH